MGSARRLASRRAGPWAPLAGSLRPGQPTKDLSSSSYAASESRILRRLRMTFSPYMSRNLRDRARKREMGKSLFSVLP